MVWTCSENGRGEITKRGYGAYQEEENEVDQKLSGRKGLEELMGEKGLMEEDWNDRSNLRKKII